MNWVIPQPEKLSLAVPDSSAWFLVLHGGKEAWHSMIPEELKMTDAW